MAVTGSLQLSHGLGLCRSQDYDKRFKSRFGRGRLPLLNGSLSSRSSFLQRDQWNVHVSDSVYRPRPVSVRNKAFRCHGMLPGQGLEVPGMKAASAALTRSYNLLKDSPLVLKLAPAIGIMIFTIWGLGPLLRQSRNMLLHKKDSNWNKSATYYVMTSYLQPLMLWLGAVLVCRALDPIILPTEASQAVKLRLLNFVRSLSTVLAFAYCLSRLLGPFALLMMGIGYAFCSLIQQAQKFFMESNDPGEARNMGFQFAGRAIYSAVWVAAASLFMELLGFSTQKWLTAGGLGTVLLTLAGREIFTNFLSSVMIHATRPFVVNEWIQTKIEGYEVSGTVEHVGWWSPTIIRGEDREAVHIPNHKFTVNVVRNLSQKTHWRIKTHLVISHRDVIKINNIVADMRKVLAKNPQVEQQKLHRRVFLDNINPENQGLMILVSCFIKTSHYEEYLCVKEAIMLDLLRVISHHRARLATPIRTMQKIYSDSDLENIPFTDPIYNRGGSAINRPLLLIEPSYRINGEDKAKSQTRSGRVTGEQDSKASSRSTPETKAGVDSKSESMVKDSPKSDTKVEPKIGDTQNSSINQEVATASAPTPTSTPKPSPASAPKLVNSAENSASELKATSSASDNSSTNQRVANSQQLQSGSPAHPKHDSMSDKPLASVSDAGPLQEASRGKKEVDRKPMSKPSVSGTALEENIVLGVALDGSKRTLPIEEGMASSPSPAEPKEMSTALRNGPGPQSSEKEKKGGQTHPSSKSGDQ